MIELAGAIRFAGKAAKYIASNFEKGDTRDINNLWTGITLSKKGRRNALIGMGIYGGYALASANYRFESDPSLAPNVNPEIQENPVAQADQVGYTNPYQYQDPLGADGSLVFALHNLRNQGYVGGN